MTPSRGLPALVLVMVAVGLAAQDAESVARETAAASQGGAVLALITRAKDEGLPAEALERLALQESAAGLKSDRIARSIARATLDLRRARAALRAAGRVPDPDEIAAGGEAIDRGAEGHTVTALATHAPADRSLVVPLFVLGSLVDRGLSQDAALAVILARLDKQEPDDELEMLPSAEARLLAQSHPPAEVARLLLRTPKPGVTDVPR